MKKLVVLLLIIWLIIGGISLLVWLKFGRSLTVGQMNSYANKLAQELEIPWEFRIKHVRSSYGADFRILVSDIEAISLEGEKLLIANKAEIRLPWTIFFTNNSERINIAVSDVVVHDWKKLLQEVEKFLNARKLDRSQEVSIPQHFLDSTFNLRFSNITGLWQERKLSLKKLFLLNIDSKHPTAFEAVFPWEFALGGASLSGEVKALGEYRAAQQKVDLHYFLRTKLQLERDERTRTGEVTLEGKGFFHPRLGLFTTVSAKEDWVSLIGDLEWSPESFKLNLPKWTLSHEFLLDLLPLSQFHRGEGAYLTSALQGEFSWHHTGNERDLRVIIHTRSGAKVINTAGEEQKFDLDFNWRKTESAQGTLKIEGIDWITYRHDQNVSFLNFDPRLLRPQEPADWLMPHRKLWDLFYWLPWSRLAVTLPDQSNYVLERAGSQELRVSQFRPRPELPMLNLVYPLDSAQVTQWQTQFESQPLDALFEASGESSFLVPGHPFTGQIWRSQPGELSFKLAWKGGVLPVLAKSSCRGVMEQQKNLKVLLDDSFAHQLEFKVAGSEFQIKKWTARQARTNWNIEGSWSNNPIRCELTLAQQVTGKKTSTHTVSLK